MWCPAERLALLVQTALASQRAVLEAKGECQPTQRFPYLVSFPANKEELLQGGSLEMLTTFRPRPGLLLSLPLLPTP